MSGILAHVVGETAYQRVLAEVRGRLTEPGTTVDALLPYLRAQGLGILQAVKVVYALLGRLDLAKTLVATSSTYRPYHDAHAELHRQLADAFRDQQPPARPERELAGPRAALTLTARLPPRAPTASPC